MDRAYGDKDPDWWPKRPPRTFLSIDLRAHDSEILFVRASSSDSSQIHISDELHRGATPSTDDSEEMLILVWNVGDLERQVKGDALVRAIVGPWSIILMQESSSTDCQLCSNSVDCLPTILHERH